MMKGHDFIGSYHPFPKEDPSSWRETVDKRQLDLFRDYTPAKLSWSKTSNVPLPLYLYEPMKLNSISFFN